MYPGCLHPNTSVHLYELSVSPFGIYLEILPCIALASGADSTPLPALLSFGGGGLSYWPDRVNTQVFQRNSPFPSLSPPKPFIPQSALVFLFETARTGQRSTSTRFEGSGSKKVAAFGGVAALLMVTLHRSTAPWPRGSGQHSLPPKDRPKSEAHPSTDREEVQRGGIVQLPVCR